MAYVHVVFTIPRKLAEIAFHNKRLLYGMLFRSSAATLLEFAADPKHLGAEIGFLSVLLSRDADDQSVPDDVGAYGRADGDAGR